MKKIVIEESGEGLLKLLGERVVVYCAIYIYSGILSGVNDTCIMLTDASIVYDTGELNASKWATSEKVPSKELYIQVSAIESFGVSSK